MINYCFIISQLLNIIFQLSVNFSWSTVLSFSNKLFIDILSTFENIFNDKPKETENINM